MVGQISFFFLLSLIFGGFAYILIKNTESLLELAWIKSSWKKNKILIKFFKFIGWWFVIILFLMWISLFL
jgi:hypothetical protein